MLQHLLNKKISLIKICLLLSTVLLFSFSETSLKKRISDADFRYEFYTTNKAVNPEPDRQYFWFKGGAIHNSEYGELLHSQFQKFYHSNQLAEAGKYNNGLKEGNWKSWFKNVHTCKLLQGMYSLYI